MIDLSRGIEKPYEIKLPDRSILRIRKPSQGILMELARLDEEISSQSAFEMIEKINDITAKIFNNNLNGKTFSNEDIAAMMDLETTILVLKDYLSYSYSLLGES